MKMYTFIQPVPGYFSPICGLLFLLISCLLPVTPADAQTVVTLGTATTSASTNALLSTSTTGNLYSKTVTVYYASDILANGGSAGNITAIRWNKQGSGEYLTADATLKIYYKHVPATQQMSTTVDWPTEVAPAIQVYSRTNQSLPTGTGYKEFVLDSPIVWNGTDNLVILVEWYRPSAPTASINWQYTDMVTTVNTTRVGSSETATHSMLRNDNRPNIQLVFAPAAPTADAGVTAITAPVSGCGLGPAVSVTITVQNFGSTTLQSIPVWFSVNSSTPVSEVVTSPVAPNSTISYTFAATADLSVPGVYTLVAATQLAADANTANDQATASITHFSSVAAPAAVNDTICIGQQATLTATGATAGQTYNWFDVATGSTALATGASFTTPALAGTTTYYVELNDGTCSSPRVPVTAVVNMPGPLSVAASATTVCTGDTVLLSASGTAAVTFSWIADAQGGLLSASGQAVQAVPTTGTTYTVVATNAQGCTTTANVAVAVTPAPSVIITGDSQICSGSAAQLTATGATSYSWSTGQTSSIVSVTPSATTTYAVTGTSGSCSVTATMQVVVEQPGQLTTVSSSDTACAGGSLSLSVMSSVPGYMFSWSAPATGGLASTSGSNVTATPTAATTYTVTGNNAVCTVSETISVGYYPQAAVVITQAPAPQGAVQLHAQVSGLPAPLSYQWSPVQYLDNPAIASPVSAAPVTVTYTVTVSSGAGCSATQTLVVFFTGTDDTAAGATLTLAPNPFHNSIATSFYAPLVGKAIAELRDLTGRVVYQQEVALLQGDNRLAVQVPLHLPAGAYLFYLQGQSFSRHARVIKQ